MMKFFHSQNYSQRKRGVTILIAALLSSILLAIGLSIFNTTLKDLFFASTAKDSGAAFYAADTAAECAQYWDYPRLGLSDTFATSSPSGPGAWVPDGKRTCAGVPIAVDVNGWTVTADINNPNKINTTFSISIPLPSGSSAYATVTVIKDVSSPNSILTTIQALGYNTSNVSSPRTVQRGVQFSY